MTQLQQLHRDIYAFLLDYHQKNPSFYFAPRTRSIPNGKTLSDGYWFNGNDDYLFIGFYVPNDGDNKTRTIGIFIKFKNEEIISAYLLITFRDEKSEPYVPFYQGILETLATQGAFQMETERKYRRLYSNPQDWRGFLSYFLEKEKPLIDHYINENGLSNEFFITPSGFDSYLKTIEGFRNREYKSNSQPEKYHSKNTISNMARPNSYPLNQILYGPPGTGKTYSTVELAYKIIHDDTPNSYEEARNWYKTALANTEDRQVEFITFHQNYSYEDFVMGIKPDLNEGDGLSFNRHEGIFFKICQRALENLKQSAKDGSIVEPTFNEVFDDFIRPLAEDNMPITIQMKSNNHSFKLININERNLGFEKQGGGTNHTLTLKTIKDLYEGNREYNIQGLGVYYYPLIEKLKSLASTKSKQVNAVPLKNYVIIIDEINRANISRVFGELITLIEEDKRWGNEFETEVRLPDGVTKFTVPKNLYIIGTMNTADKSIALLDIALRRRFEFTALYPDSLKVSPKYQPFFESLNEQIIAKKGIDFTIGHSYFMTKNGEELDFVKTMNKKVIPLLNEYFYNAKDNKLVAGLVEKAIAKAGFTHTFVTNPYQLLIE
ncbi:AAA family ATPase [Arcicella sp. DC2W]|uniref:AAA family ATPase n=1 Tax=Arcicella gelida TaxID=2984195 RepID=A0ABU5S3A1_9BACT|nr:AAA family ATPase [Arcicella sp. DC2W]MEA5402875.1 AAA family ATPase [Arcicella sp. DC2W]